MSRAASPPPPPAPIELNNQFFDWTVNATPTPPPSYIQSPFLDDSNAATVNSFLAGLGGSNVVRAVKVLSPLNTTTTNLIFNNPAYRVSYVFADLEEDVSLSGGNAVVTKQLSNQIRWVNGIVGGTATKSARAYVSEFGWTAATTVSAADVTTDPTMPGNYATKKHDHSYSGFLAGSTYNYAGLNMSSPDLYPGSPSYKSPANGDSSAPNIRSALFTLPAWRLGRTSDAIIKNGLFTHRNVPWVANFNNWGNAGLNDGAGTGGYAYYWTNPTGDQMLSSRDFATLVAHYRLRGANSFHLFDSGIVGVSQADAQAQAAEGWTESHINARMAAKDRRLLVGNELLYGGLADANSNIIEDGVSKNIEQAGAMFSGVYSIGQKKLDILLSNMDNASHKLTLPNTIAGYALNTKDFTLAGGSHLLVEYNLDKKKGWSVALQVVPFTDLDNDRSKPGVPEPGVLSLLAVAGFYGVTRRRRRNTGELEV